MSKVKTLSKVWTLTTKTKTFNGFGSNVGVPQAAGDQRGNGTVSISSYFFCVIFPTDLVSINIYFAGAAIAGERFYIFYVSFCGWVRPFNVPLVINTVSLLLLVVIIDSHIQRIVPATTTTEEL